MPGHPQAGDDSFHTCGLCVAIQPEALTGSARMPGLRCGPEAPRCGHCPPQTRRQLVPARERASTSRRARSVGSGATVGVLREAFQRGSIRDPARPGLRGRRNLIGCSWRSAGCRGVGWPVVIRHFDVLVVPPLVLQHLSRQDGPVGLGERRLDDGARPQPPRRYHVEKRTGTHQWPSLRQRIPARNPWPKSQSSSVASRGTSHRWSVRKHA